MGKFPIQKDEAIKLMLQFMVEDGEGVAVDTTKIALISTMKELDVSLARVALAACANEIDELRKKASDLR